MFFFCNYQKIFYFIELALDFNKKIYQKRQYLNLLKEIETNSGSFIGESPQSFLSIQNPKLK